MLRKNFNADWKFYKEGSEGSSVDVHLPHDAMLLEDRLPRLKNGSSVGFFPGGTYYYVKNIFGEDEYKDKCVFVEFEGIYMNSKVFINGELVGGRLYGYSDFSVDLTGKLMIGKDNELKVVANNSQVPNARWYPGSGIYRPVKLIVAEKEHIELNGVKIVTKSYKPAVIEISVEKIGTGTIETEIYKDGKLVATVFGDKTEVEIPNAKLWNEDTPELYDAKVLMKKDGSVIDEAHETFGIRMLEWSKNGLHINGTSVKLRGGCIHHDNGPLGACGFAAAEERRVRILKEAGFNAIRSAHNPISRATLDACDRLGVYIMDEAFDAWQQKKCDYDYGLYFDEEWERDLTSMVKKDMNHPAVIMYSIGNEIGDTALPSGIELTDKMTKLCHEIDGSRPVTVGINLLLNRMAKMGVSLNSNKVSKDDITDPRLEEKDGKASGSLLINILVSFLPKVMNLLVKPKPTDKVTRDSYEKVDIAGYNYGNNMFEAHLEKHPDRIIVGTETYPHEIAKNWSIVEKYPNVIGDFMWTSWDYLGEAGMGCIDYGKSSGAFSKPYPAISAGAGAVDITGYIDVPAMQAAAVWKQRKNPCIAVRPVNHSGEKAFFGQWRNTDAIRNWTYRGYENRQAEIEVYGMGASVDLLQDGKSIGRKPYKECKAVYKTTYTPGILEAVSYDNDGREIGRDLLKTAAEATVLTVQAEQKVIKADGEDLAFLVINVTDNEGIVKGLDEKKVTVQVEGAGILQAIGSGDPRTKEKYTGNSFTTYHGRLIAIVRSGMETGEIKVTASAKDLKSQQVIIRAE